MISKQRNRSLVQQPPRRRHSSRRKQQQKYLKQPTILVVVVVVVIVLYCYLFYWSLNNNNSINNNDTPLLFSSMKIFTFLSSRKSIPLSRTTTTRMVVTTPTTTTTTPSLSMDNGGGTTIASSQQDQQYDKEQLLYQITLHKVIQAALWSFFAGDALSSPTHWFYGGQQQIQQYYGKQGITSYTKPSYQLMGSILNKSNLNGGGRATVIKGKQSENTIIGHVINHGKENLWDPTKNIHYHATLQAGENTLEVSIGRVLMNSIRQNHGQFNMNHFREAYINFMTTPGSHNDTYASTCHRMFFYNLYSKKLNPIDCPDNDQHNVDTIDGLVLPTITALAIAGQLDGTIEQAMEQAEQTVRVTRDSIILQQYAKVWGGFIFQTVRTITSTLVRIQQEQKDKVNDMNDDTNDKMIAIVMNEITKDIETIAKTLQLRTPKIQKNHDEITACYLDSAVPAMLDTLMKYMPTTNHHNHNHNTKMTKQQQQHQQQTTMTVWDALLANANIGGENVHRGSCLGAIWGAVAAAVTTTSSSTEAPVSTGSKDQKNENDNDIMMTILGPQLVNGLYHHKELSNEIHSFLNALKK